jgi:DNA-binding transcriptional MerR regulator
VDASWTLPELVSEIATHIAALPAPQNGQVRAIPDDRTIRYYGTIGLLDRPNTMRGRTALYGRKHVAQVVAIKRLQTMGRSLSEIQALWPTLDDATLARMSGVELAPAARPAVRAEFWKREPAARSAPVEPAGVPVVGVVVPAAGQPAPGAAVELRVELAPNVVLSLSVVDASVAISPADVRAIRVAAAPLLAELASRRLASHPGGEEP